MSQSIRLSMLGILLAGSASAQAVLVPVAEWQDIANVFLPADMAYTVQAGPDFHVFYVDDRDIGIYIGNHPQVIWLEHTGDHGICPARGCFTVRLRAG